MLYDRSRRSGSLVAVILGSLMALTFASTTWAAIGEDDTAPPPEGPPVNGYLDDSVMIRFRAGFPSQAQRLAFAKEAGISEVMFTPLSHYFQYRTSNGRSVDATLDALKRNPEVTQSE